MSEYSSVYGVSALVTHWEAALAVDTTPTAQDLLGYEGATVLTYVGVGGITFTASNKLEIKLLHGDDATYGNAVAVESTDVIMPFGETLGTGGIIRSFTAEKAAADTEMHKVGYVGKKRYLYVLFDFSGAHGSGTDVAAHVLRDRPVSAPTDQSSYEAATTPY